MKKLLSSSSAETKRFGERMAQSILKKSGSAGKIVRKTRQGAAVLALEGELGAGKTTFTQGFAKGLGIRRIPGSPTFIIMRRYPIRGGQFKNFYHVDAYRIKKLDALETLGLKEIFGGPKNIVLVEWPEHIKKILPQRMIRLKFRHGKRETEREIFARIP